MAFCPVCPFVRISQHRLSVQRLNLAKKLIFGDLGDLRFFGVAVPSPLRGCCGCPGEVAAVETAEGPEAEEDEPGEDDEVVVVKGEAIVPFLLRLLLATEAVLVYDPPPPSFPLMPKMESAFRKSGASRSLGREFP